MAKSLSSILTQIERLQKEAAAIQSEVIARIRKEIAKYGLTAEQLFGETQRRGRGAAVAKPKKAKTVKYADGAGNTWGGMGKRPEWLRQALEAGKALEDFLVGKAAQPAPTRKRAAKVKAATPAQTKTPARKRAAAKKATRRKSPAKAAAAEAVAN